MFWDFGGVLLASPFDAFNDYEAAHGLPMGFIRSVNAADPDTNAWAQVERREMSVQDFDEAFAVESGRLGHSVPGSEVLGLLQGAVRPEMVAALVRVIEAGYVTACLTNNVVSDDRPEVRPIMARFHHVIESSKIGARKPDRAFYERACEIAGVGPRAVVFLDDLGINLKPARALGMTTIKVTAADQAIADLEAVLGVPLA